MIILAALATLAAQAAVVQPWQLALWHLADCWKAARWLRPQTIFIAILLFPAGLVWYEESRVIVWRLDVGLEFVSSCTSLLLVWFADLRSAQLLLV